MRAKGFEKSIVCGRRKRVRKEALTEVRRVARPEAFSMTDLKYCALASSARILAAE